MTRHGELWFDVESHDRMDVIPEKRAYRPGDTARFQVRMPFREATALVAVEREGVIETRTVRLSGRDPTVEVKIRDDWAPNVYISVLAVRGRLREVPWTFVFHLGLALAARMVACAQYRAAGIPATHSAGRPVEARVPLRDRRDRGRQAGE